MPSQQPETEWSQHAEVREMELENIRLAARLLAGEREDPDFETKYVFEGDGSATIGAPSGST